MYSKIIIFSETSIDRSTWLVIDSSTSAKTQFCYAEDPDTTWTWIRRSNDSNSTRQYRNWRSTFFQPDPKPTDGPARHEAEGRRYGQWRIAPMIALFLKILRTFFEFL